jgi:hypothetical protein
MGILADLVLGKAEEMPQADFEKLKELSPREIRDLAQAHIREGRRDQKVLGLFVLFLLERSEQLEKRLDRLEARLELFITDRHRGGGQRGPRAR